MGFNAVLNRLQLFLWIVILTVAIVAQETTKAPLAVLDFTFNGASKDEASLVTQEVSALFFNVKRYQMLERGKVKEIFSEQGLQQASGCEEAECAVNTGRLLGVRKIVTGHLALTAGLYSIGAKIVDVETGKIEASATRRYQGKFQTFVESELPDIVSELTGEKVIRRIQSRDDRFNIPMWSSMSVGLVSGLFAGYFLAEGNSGMNAYRDAPRKSDFRSLRSDVKSADLYSRVTLSIAAVSFGSAGFFYWQKKTRLSLSFNGSVLDVALQF